MRKHFINVLVAVGLFATISSCSKDEPVDEKPEIMSKIQARPDTGEVVQLNTTIYTMVNDNYLRNSQMSLGKYWQFTQTDTICNKELKIKFNYRGEKKNWYTPTNPNLRWGFKPNVEDEYSSTIAFEYTGPELILKLSKKVTEFGIEYSTPYYGDKYEVTQSIWDKKKKTKIADGRTIVLNTKFPDRLVWIGGASGAVLMGIKSEIPFDEVHMTIKDPKGPPITRQNLVHSIGGIRYRLAK